MFRFIRNLYIIPPNTSRLEELSRILQQKGRISQFWLPVDYKSPSINLAQAARPTLISAQLFPPRTSYPRGHMQPVPGLLSARSQLRHEAMTVKSACPRGNARRGYAQSGKLHVNGTQREREREFH